MHVHIVTAANRSAYESYLEDMHRTRHAVFVEKMGWRDIARADRRDVDLFDTDDAVYLLVINDVGDLAGSLRLTPSQTPHLLAQKQAEFGVEDLPVGHGVWEWSRYQPGSPGMGRSLLAHARAVLLTGALEFACARGIRSFTAICDTKRFNTFAELGWRLKILGGLVEYEQGRAAAVCWEVGPPDLRFARSHFGLQRPVTIEVPPLPEGDVLQPLHFSLLNELWEMKTEAYLSAALVNVSVQATLERVAQDEPITGAPDELLTDLKEVKIHVN